MGKMRNRWEHGKVLESMEKCSLEPRLSTHRFCLAALEKTFEGENLDFEARGNAPV